MIKEFMLQVYILNEEKTLNIDLTIKHAVDAIKSAYMAYSWLNRAKSVNFNC